MAFPAVVQTSVSTEDASNVTSHTVDMPAGITDGNLLIVVFGDDGSTTISWPGGWTEIAERANASNCEMSVAYRVAGASEPSTITVTTGAAQRSSHCVYEISGAEDPATQAPQIDTTAIGTSTAPNAASLTPTGGAKDYLYISAMVSDRNRTVDGFPTNCPDSQINQNGGGANSASCAMASDQVNASSFDPDAFTISASDEWVAATIAVHPGASGTTHTGAWDHEGTATQTPTPNVTYASGTNLSASASLTLKATVEHVAKIALSGTATQTAQGEKGLAGVWNHSGLATQTAKGTKGLEGVVPLSAAATQTPKPVATYAAKVPLAATATLTLVATLVTTHFAAWDHAGTAAQTPKASVTHPAKIALSGSASQTAAGTKGLEAKVSLAADAALTLVAELQPGGNTDLTGSATTTIVGTVTSPSGTTHEGIWNHSATASLTPKGVRTLGASVDLAYVADAVYANDTSYLTRGAALTGAANTKLGILAFSVRKSRDNFNEVLFHGAVSGTSKVTVLYSAGTKKISINVQRADVASTGFSVTSSVQQLATDGPVHYVAAWDVGQAASFQKLLRNGVDVSESVSVIDQNLNYAGPNDWSVLGDVLGSNLVLGDVSDVYFNTAETIDLSVAANVAKVWSNGQVDLGADGSNFTGTAPRVWLQGTLASWHTNKGTGGGFTVLGGALTDGKARPSAQASKAQLTLVGGLTRPGKVSLTAAATQTAKAEKGLEGVVTLGGQAFQTAVGALGVGGKASLTGTATLTAKAVVTHPAKTALVGSATLIIVGQGQRIQLGALSLSATATQTTLAHVDYAAKTSLVGTASVVSGAAVAFASSASLTCSATISPAPSIITTVAAAARLEATASQVALGGFMHFGVESLVGSATLTVRGNKTNIDLTGEAFLTMDAAVDWTGKIALVASSSLAPAPQGTLSYAAKIALVGSAFPSFRGGFTSEGACSLVGSASLAAQTARFVDKARASGDPYLDKGVGSVVYTDKTGAPAPTYIDKAVS